jgi:hypothetical protein
MHAIWLAILVVVRYHGLLMYVFVAIGDIIWALVTRGFYWWS